MKEEELACTILVNGQLSRWQRGLAIPGQMAAVIRRLWKAWLRVLSKLLEGDWYFKR